MNIKLFNTEFELIDKNDEFEYEYDNGLILSPRNSESASDYILNNKYAIFSEDGEKFFLIKYENHLYPYGRGFMFYPDETTMISNSRLIVKPLYYMGQEVYDYFRSMVIELEISNPETLHPASVLYNNQKINKIRDNAKSIIFNLDNSKLGIRTEYSFLENGTILLSSNKNLNKSNVVYLNNNFKLTKEFFDYYNLRTSFPFRFDSILQYPTTNYVELNHGRKNEIVCEFHSEDNKFKLIIFYKGFVKSSRNEKYEVKIVNGKAVRFNYSYYFARFDDSNTFTIVDVLNTKLPEKFKDTIWYLQK